MTQATQTTDAQEDTVPNEVSHRAVTGEFHSSPPKVGDLNCSAPKVGELLDAIEWLRRAGIVSGEGAPFAAFFDEADCGDDNVDSE